MTMTTDMKMMEAIISCKVVKKISTGESDLVFFGDNTAKVVRLLFCCISKVLVEVHRFRRGGKGGLGPTQIFPRVPVTIVTAMDVRGHCFLLEPKFLEPITTPYLLDLWEPGYALVAEAAGASLATEEKSTSRTSRAGAAEALVVRTNVAIGRRLGIVVADATGVDGHRALVAADQIAASAATLAAGL